MNTELFVILIGAGIVALAWFLLKFGKVLARWVLVFGVLAAVIILGLALLENARATRQAVKVAAMASAGAVGASGVAFLLSGMLLAALGVVGYFALRVRTAEGRPWLPKRKQRKRRLPSEPMLYTVEESDVIDLADLDLTDWGW